MSKLIVLRGLPASGKSSYAHNWVNYGWHETREYKRAVVSRDAIREKQFGSSGKKVLSYEKEQAVTKIQQSMVKDLLESDYEVIIDDLNLRPKYVREWRRVAQRLGAKFEVKEFPVEVEVAIAWDADRDSRRAVGSKVIIDLAQKYYPKGKFLPVPDEVAEVTPYRYVPNEDLFPAYVFDIDGTLALNEGGRSYYDLTRVGEDTPNHPVIVMALTLHTNGYRVLFCSGRDESAREATLEWIREELWDINPQDLIMRKEGDQRRDFIVKAELFDNEIAPKYNVLGIFDDRPSVCRMWRVKGIPVFQVGDPHVEF